MLKLTKPTPDLLSLLSLFICLFTNGQAVNKLPKIHSHNDYDQTSPFYEAFRAGAASVEIDVFYKNKELMVAHEEHQIQPERTFTNLYVKPLQHLLADGEYIHTISYLVDVKTEAYSTLEKLVEETSRYPHIFNNKPHGLKLIISGNRPRQQDFHTYPEYIFFDSREPSDRNERNGDRIKMVSRDFSDFTKWKGENRFPQADSVNLVRFVQDCHNNMLPVRFWNTPDEHEFYKKLIELKADYIHTDQPYQLANFLDTLDSGIHLDKWHPGLLDIHHIQTGRGNATYIVCPDGTAMLIDMGDMSETHTRNLSHRNTPITPNNTKTPAEWVADYIKQFHPKNRKLQLDYALITHYHDDHFGEIAPYREKHKNGNYTLTGITELGSIIPISTLVDRGTSFPINLKDHEVCTKFDLYNDSYSMMQTLEQYWKFIDYQKTIVDLKHEDFIPGSEQQFLLKQNAASYKNFKISNLFVNGQYINAEGKVTSIFSEGSYPGENELSAGIKITYGDFDYYTGGDINGIGDFGEENTQSTEYRYAPVIGPVDAATLNHHGGRDSQCPRFVRTLRPTVWVQQGWSSDHPGNEVLGRITSKKIYPGDRDVFATALLKANHLVLGSDVEDSFRSLSGHIVIRVYPNGKEYSVFVLNDKTKSRKIISEHKYQSH